MEIGRIDIYDNSFFSLKYIKPEFFDWILFLNEDQRAKFNDKTNNIVKCNSNNEPLFPFEQIAKAEKFPLNVTLKKTGVYYVFACSCSSSSEYIDWEASISKSYVKKNKNEAQGMLYVSYCELIAYTLIVGMITKNLCSHKRMKEMIHYMLYGCVIIHLITTIVNIIVFRQCSSNLSSKTMIVSDVFNGIATLSLLLLCSSFSLGLSCTIDKLHGGQIATILIIDLFYAISQTISNSSNATKLSEVFIFSISICALVAYAVYSIFFIISLMKTIGVLNSHLILIAKTGVDPDTTPTFRKIIMLKIIAFFSLVTFLFQSITVFLTASRLIRHWIAYIFIHILNIMLISALSYFRRVRRAMKAKIATEMPDLDKSDDDGAFERKGTKWTEGIALPPMPETSLGGTKVEGDYGVSPW